MDIFEFVISIIFIIGIGLVLYLILRDPIFMFKSFLRGLKSHPNWAVKIIFSPIWLPWVVDKIFGLKLYIKEFENASRPQKISFSEFDKYIYVNSPNVDHVEKVLHSFGR